MTHGNNTNTQRNMKIQQDRQSSGNKSRSPALNELGATTSRQVQPEAADDTSHHSKPGRDELVPSRYALRVGEIDVMVVSDGVLSLPGAMLGHNADPAVRAAWLEDTFLPPDMLEWALNAVVVRSGGRTILIDAGIGMDQGLNLSRAGKLIHRLKA